MVEKQDRLSAVVGQMFKPDSLVGSFFHGDGLQGCVVAEVAPQWYLLETFEWLMGSSCNQILRHLSAMADWKFYDDDRWMRNAENDAGTTQSYSE